MKIKVLLFAKLKEDFGKESLILETSEGETVGGVVEQLAEHHGMYALHNQALFFAVNESFADKNEILKDGDTLACLAPMSGGAI